MKTLRKLFVPAFVIVGLLGLLTPRAHAIDVLYVIGGDQAQNGLSRGGDILINDFFVGRGYNVQLMDEEVAGDEMLAASNASDLTFISESVSSSNVTNKVTSSPTGIITTEAFLQDDLLFTLNDDCCRGDVSDMTEVNVVDDLGLDVSLGPLPVLQSNGRLGWGAPGGDVAAFSTVVGNAEQITNYIYEAGAALNDGSAAAGRRVFMGSMTGMTLDDNPPWTPQGEALFGAAVDYALVPEPSAVILLVFGLAGLVGMRRQGA